MDRVTAVDLPRCGISRAISDFVASIGNIDRSDR